MKKEFIKGKNGYDIPCLHNISGNDTKVVIIIHEFRSVKFTPVAAAVSQALEEEGIASICFDFPGHDESPVDGDMFLMHNCINDLSSVEEFVRASSPDAKIEYFASSFGAYTLLLHFSLGKPLGSRAFLRCAAVDMATIIEKSAGPEALGLLKSQGYVIIDKGPLRPLKMMYGLYEDFTKYRPMEIFKKGLGEFEMIHGALDKNVPLPIVQSFADKFDIPLIIIEDTDHYMFKPKTALVKVVDEAVKFFKRS
ncbi:MAG: alpha/beta hydrolase [Clostridia bacterium]|nr:alpha/beta hydrolase [Clostridia bacterium]